MSNSIEKYSFGAKTDNEGKIIVGILSKFYDNRLEFIGQYNTSYHITGGELHCSVLQSNSLDIDDLVAMAKRGFKEAWDVPPDGERFVTGYEFDNYPCPEFGNLNGYSSGRWAQRNSMAWKDGTFKCKALTVPLDFTFEPVVKELTVAEISEKLGFKIKVVQ